MLIWVEMLHSMRLVLYILFCDMYILLFSLWVMLNCNDPSVNLSEEVVRELLDAPPEVDEDVMLGEVINIEV